jgi:HlyD family secretion protein
VKTWLKVLLIVLGAAALVVLGISLLVPPRAVTVDALGLDAAAVQRGNIQVTVHGTGMLEVDEVRDVYAQATGRVAEVYKEEGDTVQAGELLALLQSETLEDTLRSTSDDLYVKDLELATTRQGRAVTAIRATMAGRVKLLNARKGDDMNTVQKQYGALAVLSTDGRMRVELPAPADWASLEVPQTVKVSIGSQVESGTLLSADDKLLTVLIQNDTYTPGERAIVRSEAGAEMGNAPLIINKPLLINGVSGKIRSVNVDENDKVRAQDRLFTLEDDAVSLDVEKQLLARDALQRKLDDTRKDIAELEIRSPITGVLAAISPKVGATVQDGTQVATVIQTDRAKVRLAVDELDVAAVYPGQNATLKIDAIPGKRYETTVDRVLPVGERANDITSYNVLMYLDARDNMLPYMSLAGDIVVATADNALLVPVAALQTVGDDKYVMLMPTDADLVGYNANMRRPANRMMTMAGASQNDDVAALQAIAPQLMRRVEVGLISSEYAQIVSGLNEGERVVLPRSTSNLFTMMGGMRPGGALQ